MSATEGVRDHSATAEHALGSLPRVHRAVFLSRLSSVKCWLLTMKTNALLFSLGLGGLRSTAAAIEVEHDEAVVSGYDSCSKGESNKKGHETGDRERSRDTTSNEYDKDNTGSLPACNIRLSSANCLLVSGRSTLMAARTKGQL